jgi:phage gp36-like protein
MSYCTVDDLIARFGDTMLIQLTGLPDQIDYSVVATAISDASAEIDGYIGGRYSVPIIGDAAAPLLRIACDLAIYNLWKRVSRFSEPIQKAHDDAVAYLSLLGQGKISLGYTPPPKVDYELVRMTQSTRPFGFTSDGQLR